LEHELSGSAASHIVNTSPASFLNTQIYHRYVQFTAHKASPAHVLDFIGDFTEKPFLEPIGVTKGKSVSVAPLVANTVT
jgi:hypothetical protein